jgi:hypothetical protein
LAVVEQVEQAQTICLLQVAVILSSQPLLLQVAVVEQIQVLLVEMVALVVEVLLQVVEVHLQVDRETTVELEIKI